MEQKHGRPQKGRTNKVQIFVNSCLRKILKVKWDDKIRNEEIWEKTSALPMEEELGRRRWRWIGHALRKPSNSITRQALNWNPQGARKRGRPKLTWRRGVEKDREKSGKTWSQLAKLAQDREKWRSFVCGLYPDRGDGQ